MPERVLVTGATGFVGSHIAEALVGAGYRVRCGVRKAARWASGLDAELVPLDLSRPGDLPRAVRGADVVIHAGGITRARHEEGYRRINAEGTRVLAEAASAAGVRRFVLISSLAARGPDGAAGPASPYGLSKLEAEEIVRSFEGRMEVCALRPAAVYGPRDTDLLPLFRTASRGFLLIPRGPGVLQPLYATDAARAALAAARGTAGFGPYPVAERSRYGWGEIVGGLERAFGRRVRAVRLPAAAFVLAGRAFGRAAGLGIAPPVFDERRARDLAIHTWTCDVSETEAALGWRAEVPLAEGLLRSTRWYREEGWI